MENLFIFTVSELTKHVKNVLEPACSDVRVEGEISNMRVPASGHCYFTLKDERSRIRAVMFRMKNRLLKFKPEDGLKVVCRGRINIYEPRGEYQLIVDAMEPRGAGELQLVFEQLKKKLHDEGLFDNKKKQSLPFLADKIAVVTSPTGAAVRDIIKVISRRFPNMEVIVVPVRVQGDDAPGEIAEAIKVANNLSLADVIILARGGGSLEDLWAFNTEMVARAVFESAIPVVSAIGHETDFTIADFVADLRAPTPSGAAELVVKEKKEIIKEISHLKYCLKNALSQRIEQSRARVNFFYSHLHRPEKQITDYQLHHDDLHMRLVNTISRFIKRKESDTQNALKIILSHSPMNNILNRRIKTDQLTKYFLSLVKSVNDRKKTLLQSSILQLNSLSPLNVLGRGYSIIRVLPSMDIVKNAASLRQGDCINVQFSKGGVDCLVKKVIE